MPDAVNIVSAIDRPPVPSPRSRAALLLDSTVAVMTGIAIMLRVFLGKRMLRGIPGQRLAASLGAAASGLKLAHLCVLAIRKEVPAGRVLLPAIVFVELLRISIGHASRTGMLFAVGFFELLVIIFAIAQLRRLPATDRTLETEIHYERVFAQFLPEGIATLLSRELVVLWSGVRWVARGFRAQPVPGFGYAQNSTVRMLPMVVPLLTLGDEIVLGVLLRHQAAWIRLGVVALDVWAVLWVFGMYATFLARPHQVESGRVRLSVGVFSSCDFDPALLVEAKPFADELPRAAKKSFGLLTVHGTPTVKIRLREPVAVRRFIGAERSYDTLLVAADDAHSFCRALMAAQG